MERHVPERADKQRPISVVGEAEIGYQQRLQNYRQAVLRGVVPEYRAAQAYAIAPEDRLLNT